MFTNEEAQASYAELQRRAQSGNLMNASRVDLERYGMLLSRPQASSHFAGLQYPQICEFVRTLLIVRLSEESERRALEVANESLEVSRRSLTVAWIALFLSVAVGVAQIFLAYKVLAH